MSQLMLAERMELRTNDAGVLICQLTIGYTKPPAALMHSRLLKEQVSVLGRMQLTAWTPYGL